VRAPSRRLHALSRNRSGKLSCAERWRVDPALPRAAQYSTRTCCRKRAAESAGLHGARRSPYRKRLHARRHGRLRRPGGCSQLGRQTRARRARTPRVAWDTLSDPRWGRLLQHGANVLPGAGHTGDARVRAGRRPEECGAPPTRGPGVPEHRIMATNDLSPSSGRPWSHHTRSRTGRGSAAAQTEPRLPQRPTWPSAGQRRGIHRNSFPTTPRHQPGEPRRSHRPAMPAPRGTTLGRPTGRARPHGDGYTQSALHARLSAMPRRRRGLRHERSAGCALDAARSSRRLGITSRAFHRWRRPRDQS